MSKGRLLHLTAKRCTFSGYHREALQARKYSFLSVAMYLHVFTKLNTAGSVMLWLFNSDLYRHLVWYTHQAIDL